MKAFSKIQANKNGDSFYLEKALVAGRILPITKINYCGEIFPIVEDGIKQGNSFTDISDNSNLPIKKVEIYGETVQQTYLGYNHLPQNYISCGLSSSVIINGITFAVDNIGRIQLFGTTTSKATFVIANESSFLTLEKGKTYYLYGSENSAFNNAYLELTGLSSGQKIICYSQPVPFIANDVQYKLELIIEANTDIINKEFLPMITETEEHVFEPYVGLYASPSNAYPQEIYSVGKNDLEIEYSIGETIYVETIPTTTFLTNGQQIKLNLARVGEFVDKLIIDVENNKVLYEHYTDSFGLDTSSSVAPAMDCKFVTSRYGYKQVICNMARPMSIAIPPDIKIDSIGIFDYCVILGYPMEQPDNYYLEYFRNAEMLGVLRNPETLDITATTAGEKLLDIFSKQGIKYFRIKSENVSVSNSITHYKKYI